MRANRREIETIARVRGLNHEALRMIKKIKALEEPEEGVFRDRILVNNERMRLAMERVGLLLEVRLHSKDLDFGEYSHEMRKEYRNVCLEGRLHRAPYHGFREVGRERRERLRRRG